jgi:hypothetical protein
MQAWGPCAHRKSTTPTENFVACYAGHWHCLEPSRCTVQLMFRVPPPGWCGAPCLPSLHLPNVTTPTKHPRRCSSSPPPNRSFVVNRKRHIFVVTFLQKRPSILSLLGRCAARRVVNVILLLNLHAFYLQTHHWHWRSIGGSREGSCGGNIVGSSRGSV